MFKNKRLLMVSLVVFMMVGAVLACSSGPITETISEEELNEDMADTGFAIDLQPGVVVMEGVVEGQDMVMKMTMEEVDGDLEVQITEVTVGGIALPQEMYAQFNEDLSEEFRAEMFSEYETYTVISIEITEDDITLEYEAE